MSNSASLVPWIPDHLDSAELIRTATLDAEVTNGLLHVASGGLGQECSHRETPPEVGSHRFFDIRQRPWNTAPGCSVSFQRRQLDNEIRVEQRQHNIESRSCP